MSSVVKNLRTVQAAPLIASASWKLEDEGGEGLDHRCHGWTQIQKMGNRNSGLIKLLSVTICVICGSNSAGNTFNAEAGILEIKE